MKKNKIKIFKILVKKGCYCWFLSSYNPINGCVLFDSFNPYIYYNIDLVKSIVNDMRQSQFLKSMDIFIISDYVKVSDKPCI